MVTITRAWAVYHAALQRRHVRPASAERYRRQLDTWHAWLAEQRPPRDWVRVGPDDWAAFLRRRCRPGGRNVGRPLAPGSRAAYGRRVLDYYRVLYAEGVLRSDPLRSCVAPRAPRPAERPLDLGDVARLLEHVHDHPDPRLELLAHLCYYALLRAGETALLEVGDLDLGDPDDDLDDLDDLDLDLDDGDDLEFDRRLPRINVLGKGHDEREWFPLHAAAVPAVRRYLAWLCARHGVQGVRDLPAGTPLIQDLRLCGKGVGRSYPSLLLAAAMRDAKVAGRPHDLRRTAAHEVGRASGDNLGQLRAVLRHAGWGAALDAYRRPSLGEVAGYLAQIPNPLEDA